MPDALYLIDGHAQIYRCYYAPFRELSSPTGEPTKATYVFSQMLLSLVRDRRPTHLAMVMDVGGVPTFRDEMYTEYRAHRESPPRDPIRLPRRGIGWLRRRLISRPCRRSTAGQLDELLPRPRTFRRRVPGRGRSGFAGLRV